MTASTEVPASITTPDTVETRLGTQEFDDGASTADTAERLYDHLDVVRGVEAFLYDRRTRSMLQTAQPMPSQSSHSGTVEQNADGSTDLHFGPRAPVGRSHNMDPDRPGEGWFPILRLYSPLQPSFDKTWRPSEIEPYDPASE